MSITTRAKPWKIAALRTRRRDGNSPSFPRMQNRKFAGISVCGYTGGLPLPSPDEIPHSIISVPFENAGIFLKFLELKLKYFSTMKIADGQGRISLL